MAGRDDFSTATIRTIAGRAGYLCSFPDCGRLTVGSSDDRASGLSMVGVAAHITAAAPGGERYDPALSAKQRAGTENGIWMCQTHAKWIDDNPSKATATDLLNWKRSHELAVSERVKHGSALPREGVTSLSMRSVGIFRDAPAIRFGRFNVVYGLNASGKSTLCQCLAAFAGGGSLTTFVERFGVRAVARRDVQIASSARLGESTCTVTLARAEPDIDEVDEGEEPSRGRLHVEVDGAVAIDWPRRLFPVVHLDDLFQDREFRTPIMDAVTRNIAKAFGMDVQDILDGLRPDLFATAPFGYSFRLKDGDIEVRRKGQRHFQVGDTLGGGEVLTAAAEIVLRLARAKSAGAPWTLLLDSAFFLRLDESNRQLLVDTLLAQSSPSVQLFVCVNYRDEASPILSDRAGEWISATEVGRLTIHAFR